MGDIIKRKQETVKHEPPQWIKKTMQLVTVLTDWHPQRNTILRVQLNPQRRGKKKPEG